MKAGTIDLPGLPLTLVKGYLFSILLPFPYIWAALFAFLLSVVMLLIAQSSRVADGGLRFGRPAMMVLVGLCVVPTASVFLSPLGIDVRLFSEFFQYFFVAIIFIAGVFAFGRPGGLSQFVFCAAWITLPLSLYGIGRARWGWALEWSSFVTVAENNYASIFILLFGVALPSIYVLSPGPKRYFYLVSIGLGLVAIHFHTSRASMLAALACIVAVAAVGRTRLVTGMRVMGLIVAGAIISLFLFDSEDVGNPDSLVSLVNFDSNFSNIERLQYLRAAAHSLVSFPFGQGIGTASSYFMHNAFSEIESPTPHNTAALLAAEMGVQGLASYCILFALLLVCPVSTMLRRYSQPIAHRRLLIVIPLILLMVTIYDAVFFNGGLTAIFFLAAATVFTTPQEKIRTLRQG